MQSKERRTKAKEALRSKILDAARTLFAQRGYEAVTMREIARQISYTATALYYHFPDKETLLRELCETDFRSLSDYFRRLGRILDPVERIRKTSLAYVNFGLEYPQHYRLMFMTPHPEPHPDQYRIERGNPDEDAYAFLHTAVQEAIAEGRFRPELKDSNLIAQIIWSGVHGLVALHLTKTESRWIDWRPAGRTADLLTETLLHGLLRKTPT
ncbi:MAG: TetR/AcrR family transcriptional regulator [Verrucomicrobiota bacterium]